MTDIEGRRTTHALTLRGYASVLLNPREYHPSDSSNETNMIGGPPVCYQ